MFLSRQRLTVLWLERKALPVPIGIFGVTRRFYFLFTLDQNNWQRFVCLFVCYLCISVEFRVVFLLFEPPCVLKAWPKASCCEWQRRKSRYYRAHRMIGLEMLQWSLSRRYSDGPVSCIYWQMLLAIWNISYFTTSLCKGFILKCKVEPVHLDHFNSAVYYLIFKRKTANASVRRLWDGSDRGWAASVLMKRSSDRLVQDRRGPSLNRILTARHLSLTHYVHVFLSLFLVQ